MNIYQSPTTQSKFQVYCSCIHCKLEVSVQNIERHHYSKHTHKTKPSCIVCGMTCSPHSKRFCSRSCSATYTNKLKDHSKIKYGPEKGSVIPHNKKPPHTKLSQCVVCSKLHPRSGKTCSDNCYRTLSSLTMKQAISNGYDPKKNRGRGKKSYLEISFEKWLNTHFPSIEYIPEYPIKRQDMLKTYFGDFYFPSKNLIIELDGTQHNNTTEYDQGRDTYITETYGIQVFRISHKEYINQSKIDVVINMLS